MLTSVQIIDAIRDEAGVGEDASSDTEKMRWFVEGLNRLGRYVALDSALTWAAAATSVDLPADFIELVKLDFPSTVVRQPFRIFGRSLYIDTPGGASAAGSATLFYYGEYPAMANTGDTSLATRAEDDAAIYFACHKLYRSVAGDRVRYQRYSTLLGANAISVADLQNQSDRYLQDFVDARADLQPRPPAAYYSGA